jgi:beta-xylosidase
MVGVNGKAVVTYRKPSVGGTFPVTDLPVSDEFSGTTPGMQWGWNHNPYPAGWSLTQRPGFLRLTTVSKAANLREAPNMLTQRPFAGYDPSRPVQATVRLEADHLKNGDLAGLAMFQDPYAFIAVRKNAGALQLVMVNNGAVVDSLPMKKTGTVFLRTVASNSKRVASFEYSFDNKTFHPLGNELHMQFSLRIFTGNKFGLFHFATVEPGGYSDFDWFRVN